MVVLWLVINFLIIVGIIIGSLVHETDGLMLQMATVISQLAVIVLLLNMNMYFIFLIIRKSKVRKVKLTLAKISRKIMKMHVPIAISAASLIVLHIAFILLSIPINLKEPKFVTGLMATTGLTITLFAGYMRSRKANGKRRGFHIITAFTFFLFVLVHVFSTY